MVAAEANAAVVTKAPLTTHNSFPNTHPFCIKAWKSIPKPKEDKIISANIRFNTMRLYGAWKIGFEIKLLITSPFNSIPFIPREVMHIHIEVKYQIGTACNLSINSLVVSFSAIFDNFEKYSISSNVFEFGWSSWLRYTILAVNEYYAIFTN